MFFHVVMDGLGVGKTYLARALAGEANVNFYAVSGILVE